MLPILHEVVAGVFVFWKQSTEKGVAKCGSDGVGESATGILKGSIGIEELWADDPGIGI